MARTSEEKKDADKRFMRFRKSVEIAISNEGSGMIPPEWAGDPLILKVRLMAKEIAVTNRKAQHGCYDFNCPECDK